MIPKTHFREFWTRCVKSGLRRRRQHSRRPRLCSESLEDRVLLSAVNYAIVDTGQTDSFDNSHVIADPSPGEAFYGQDAQHEGNQFSYTVSSDGLTVLDNVSGLTWTQGADWSGDGTVNVNDKFTYAEAQTYVDTLNAQNYGGYNDWRVPTIKELYSLIDYTGTDPDPTASNSSGLVPFINDDVFEFVYGDTSAGERIIDSQWATNTLYVSTVMDGQQAMFGVNFADGRIKGYPAEANPDGSEKTFYVRFCRGNTDYGENSFEAGGDGTVTDSATGLMWSQTDSGVGMNWEDALAWVQQMNDENYLGHNDWRLPNAKELQSLVDYTRSPDTTNSAAIDPLFSASEITNEAGESDYPFYWSSTTFLRFDGSADRAVYVAFGEGLGSMDGVNVIDVHGAGCQRSDPKDGDPNAFPSWGHGPQGDVQRVFNFVRLVRDANNDDGGGADVGPDAIVVEGLPDNGQADNFVVRRNAQDKIIVAVNGVAVARVPADEVSQVVINGSNDPDLLKVVYPSGKDLPQIVFNAEGGHDELIVQGTSGNDVIAVSPDGRAVDVNGNGIELSGVEAMTLNGNNGNDRIDASAASDAVKLDGSDGDDTLIGSRFNDTLIGGTGHDGLAGGPGHDYLAGWSGNDTLLGGDGDDTLLGGDGNDTLLGEAGDDFVKGQRGTDVVAGGGNGTAASPGDVIVGPGREIDELFSFDPPLTWANGV